MTQKIPKKMTATVIGLGSIGWGAACSLVREGYKTYGVVRRDEVMQKFTAQGGIGTKDIHSAVADSDVVFIYVVNDIQTKDILFGDNTGNEGCVTSAKAGTVFVLGSTMPSQTTIQIAEKLQQAGMDVLDAPVSGDAKKSLAGQLTLMASGKAETFAKIDGPLKAVSGNLFNLGETIGAGSSMKLINQVLSMIHISSAGEAMAMAHRMGLDLPTVYDVILKSAGCSWMFENRAAHVLKGDYTPKSALNMNMKDLKIILQEAKDLDFDPALVKTTFDLVQGAIDDGFGEQDDSVMAKWIARKNGFRIKGDT